MMKFSAFYIFAAAAILATSINAAESKEKPKPGPLKDGEKDKPTGSGGNATDVSNLESSGASDVGAYFALGAAGIAALVL
jgi:hypothetical protein